MKKQPLRVCSWSLIVTLTLTITSAAVAQPVDQAAFTGDRLKDLVPPDFEIGGVLGGYDTDLNTLNTADLVRREFTAVTVKAFMPFGPWTDPNQPIDTSALVNNIAWARQNGKRVHAHILTYPTENVRLPWFRDLPNEDVEPTLRQYVQTMAGAVAGDVWVWDVVNEIIGDNGDVMDADGLRIGLGSGDGFLPYKEYEAMGPDYIAKSFRWARQADPNATLIVNEYSAETVNDKSDRLLAYCIKLRNEGVPIDGVGFQNHWLDTRYEPNYDSIRANFQRFADAGFQIFITECDIASTISRDDNPTPPTAAQLATQRRVFGNLMQIALEQPACKSFLMWDFTDDTSWLQNTNFTLTLADRRPGFSDTVIPPGASLFATPMSGGNGTTPIRPKAAYFGLQQALVDHNIDTVRLTSGWDWTTSFLGRFGTQSDDGSWAPDDGTYLQGLDANSRTWSNLKWDIERVDTGIFRIRNRWENGADYLTRQGFENGDGQFVAGSTVAMQSLDTTWFSQQWYFIRQSDGGFRLTNAWSPESGTLTREAGGIDAQGQFFPGSEIRLYPDADWSSQVWYFDRITP